MANLGQAIAEALAGALAGYAQGYTGQNYLKGILDAQAQRREAQLKREDMVFDVAKAKKLKEIDIQGAKDIAEIEKQSALELQQDQQKYDARKSAADRRHELALAKTQGEIELATREFQAALDAGNEEKASLLKSDLMKLEAQLSEERAQADQVRNKELQGLEFEFEGEQRAEDRLFQASESKKERAHDAAKQAATQAHERDMMRLNSALRTKEAQLESARNTRNALTILHAEKEYEIALAERNFEEARWQTMTTLDAQQRQAKEDNLIKVGMKYFEETGNPVFLQPFVSQQMKANAIDSLPEDATPIDRLMGFMNGVVSTSSDVANVVTRTQLQRDASFKTQYEDRLGTVVSGLDFALAQTNPEEFKKKAADVLDRIRNLEGGFMGSRGQLLTDEGVTAIQESTSAAVRQVRSALDAADDALDTRNFKEGNAEQRGQLGPELTSGRGLEGFTVGPGLPAEDVRRLYGGIIEEQQPTWEGVTTLVSAFQDEELTIDDIKEPSVRKLVSILLGVPQGPDEIGPRTLAETPVVDMNQRAPGPLEKNLFQYLMGDRNNAEAVFGAVEKLGVNTLQSSLEDARKASTRRRTIDRAVGALPNVKVRGKSLQESGFSVSEDDFVVRPPQQDKEGNIVPAKLEVRDHQGFVDRLQMTTHLNYDPADPVASAANGVALIKTIKKFGAQAELSQEEVNRLLRAAVPDYENVLRQQFNVSEASASVERIFEDLTDDSAYQEYYKVTYGGGTMGGFVELPTRFKQNLDKESSVERRKEVYKKHGFVYDETLDGILLSGGRYVGNQVIRTAMSPTEGLLEFELNKVKLQEEIALASGEDATAFTEARQKMEIVSADATSTRNVQAQAEQFFQELAYALADGPDALTRFYQSNAQVKQQGLLAALDADGQEDQIKAWVSAAYGQLGFEAAFTLAASQAMPKPEAGILTAGQKAQFSDYVVSMAPPVGAALRAASQFESGSLPEPMVNRSIVIPGKSKRKLRFPKVFLLTSKSEDYDNY